MAVPIPLGYLRSRSASGNRMDVVLQSRTSKYGIGRIHPKTAAGHGCIALLLLSTVKNGGITLQHQMAAAHDRQEGRALPEGDFFVPRERHDATPVLAGLGREPA